MNRREFVKIVTAAGAIGSVTRAAAQPSTNPKIIFFGMSIVGGGGTAPLTITLPGSHGHSAFMLAPAAAITAFGGTAKPTANAGLEEAHTDLQKNQMPAWCLPAGPMTVGSGPATITAGLQKRLPSITAMAKAFTGNSYSVSPATLGAAPAITLGGGTLKEPQTPSRCVATHAGINWTFYAGPAQKQIGGPFNVTDMAQFESASPTLVIGVGSRQYTMKAGETMWIFNLPPSATTDTTPQLIENGHDWVSLVSPAFPSVAVTAETKQPVRRLKATKQFHHPCSPPVAMSYIPPDTDPCFMVAP
jgi:hypothetical protein